MSRVLVEAKRNTRGAVENIIMNKTAIHLHEQERDQKNTDFW